MKVYKVAGDYVVLYPNGEYSSYTQGVIYIPAVSPRRAIERAEGMLHKEQDGGIAHWFYGVEATEVSMAEHLRIQGYQELL